MVSHARTNLRAVNSSSNCLPLFLVTTDCFKALAAPKHDCLAVCSSRTCDAAQRLGGAEDTLKAAEKVQTACLDTLCMMYDDRNTFCFRSRRGAIMTTVRCKPRRCMLRALDMCALPRLWAAQAVLAASCYTNNWSKVVREVDGHGTVAMHIRNDQRAFDVECDLSRSIFSKA